MVVSLMFSVQCLINHCCYTVRLFFLVVALFFLWWSLACVVALAVLGFVLVLLTAISHLIDLCTTLTATGCRCRGPCMSLFVCYLRLWAYLSLLFHSYLCYVPGVFRWPAMSQSIRKPTQRISRAFRGDWTAMDGT